MTKKQEIQLFNDRSIRTIWDDKEEKWYFSVVDVIETLTDSPDPSTYWRVLKNRLKKEGNETVTTCNAFSRGTNCTPPKISRGTFCPPT